MSQTGLWGTSLLESDMLLESDVAQTVAAGTSSLESDVVPTVASGTSSLESCQFYHGLQFEVSEPFPGKDPNKPDAVMFVKGKELVVTRGWQRDFRQDVKNGENVPCWFIHNNGNGLLDGVHTDYIVPGLFKTI
ncbi:inter-alpha-trypsin inhibitor heavy chain H3-like protein [Labeo rohita]|uniref:Inter-alpha-trypsin inhibitor heavy chain H3-like protein n=1 Tax=Labeo rohita TaxID=84645 RepID=A0A498LMX5_LABRO|nr:inter-alpha-trypsin inhibitor heavy chain H3-like protein [Labeo rohita]